MELNASTFILEIVNFLVLIWILQRFLYRPVMAVIARRQAAIREQLDEARQRQEAGEGLRRQYESRLEDWQREREKARQDLDAEIEALRSKRLQTLDNELAQLRDKAKLARAHQQAEQQRENESAALDLASAFVTRLLEQMAGPDLEALLIDLALQQLSTSSTENRLSITQSWSTPPSEIQVESAYPLSVERQQILTQQLQVATGLDAAVAFHQTPGLLAGLRITLGSWVLQANLRDELRGFTEFARHG